jgi:hypothetical protein
MKNILLIFFLAALSLNSCYDVYKYHIGTFPEMPVNMGDINSEYDDYNSDSPIQGGSIPLCFSSNRVSKGINYDIIYKYIDVIWSKKTGELNVSENFTGSLDNFTANANLMDAVKSVNTMYNEFGPYLIPQGDGYIKVGSGWKSHQDFIFLYSSDEPGDLDIKFTQNLESTEYSRPMDIVFLNSEKDDAYPTLNSDSSEIYFCSNRESNFDIYRANVMKETNLLAAFSDSTARTITKELQLSSDYNDKCPFIVGNLLVFTSDRPGGFGGFDLYYSEFVDGSWSLPVNFGDKINTAYDEYRPIVRAYFKHEFTNDFMIFSSNRPGGKGGFDLYYTGIKKMTE